MTQCCEWKSLPSCLFTTLQLERVIWSHTTTMGPGRRVLLFPWEAEIQNILEDLDSCFLGEDLAPFLILSIRCIFLRKASTLVIILLSGSGNGFPLSYCCLPFSDSSSLAGVFNPTINLMESPFIRFSFITPLSKIYFFLDPLCPQTSKLRSKCRSIPLFLLKRH